MPVQEFVEEAYRRLAAVPGFIVREGQKALSLSMAQAYLDKVPFAAEAPTGTGKTIAYLIGALAASESMKDVRSVPIVVATATVGLQSQIIAGDLPLLVKANILSGGDYTLAKGRGRYFCPDSAEQVLEENGEGAQTDLFDAKKNEAAAQVAAFEPLLQRWSNREWDGDFDSYPFELPLGVSRVSASAHTCLGPKCAHYNDCPFFSARRGMGTSRIIVANHDLVLADLAMSKEDSVDPLFPGTQYFVVFDEAHHLPVKAQEAGSAMLSLKEAQTTAKFIGAYNDLWNRIPGIIRVFSKAKLDENSFSANGILAQLQTMQGVIDEIEIDEDLGYTRFSPAGLPRDLANVLATAAAMVDDLLPSFVSASGKLKEGDLVEKNPALRPIVTSLLYAGARIMSDLQGLQRALAIMRSDSPGVRWVARDNEGEMSLHVAPLDGCAVLKSLLWDNVRAVPAMVSATIRDFGGYERFKAQLGVQELRTETLPHIFPYNENQLRIAALSKSPKYAERAEFEAEMLHALPRLIDSAEGTLVLCPSRSMMLKVAHALRERFGHNTVLVQYEKGIKELVADHKREIGEGRGSILCGLATMAEGLDLPGKFCTHVVICTLPFAVPTSPVEVSLQEAMGRDYFYKKVLPDTLVKLTQMVGRLMRRESDRGKITIMDNRLANTKWGTRMLHALPPFRRVRLVPSQERAPVQVLKPMLRAVS